MRPRRVYGSRQEVTVDDETEAKAEINADEIKRKEANRSAPRGNVHSETDETPVQNGPPPMPN